MGEVRMGPPTEMTLLLRDNFDIPTFFETGTWKGATAAWAANHFSNVITIEADEDLYNSVVALHADVPNIKFVLGDTLSQIDGELDLLEGDVLFWLDSHWCSCGSFGELDQCPLINEIEAIGKHKQIRPFILIDDARLFMSPPPLPNDMDQWPSISDVIHSLEKAMDVPYIVIFEDVIIAAPSEAQRSLMNFCQKMNTEHWENRQQSDRFGVEGIPKRIKRYITSAVRKL